MAADREIRKLECGQPVQSLAFTRDGPTLFAAGRWGGVKAWEPASGKPEAGPNWPHTSGPGPRPRSVGKYRRRPCRRRLSQALGHRRHGATNASGSLGRGAGRGVLTDGKTLASASVDRQALGRRIRPAADPRRAQPQRQRGCVFTNDTLVSGGAGRGGETVDRCGRVASVGPCRSL